MKTLVTGAAGFIGSHLCEYLVAHGHDVTGLDDLSNGSLSNLASLQANPKFHMILCDILKWETETRFDCIFHLAAKADIVPSIDNPMAYHQTNVDGTVRLLEIARRTSAGKFVYAASSSCYGIPLTYPTPELNLCAPMYPYALTKYIGEQYVLHWSKMYKIPAVSLRLFNVYGPRHRTSGAYGAVFGTWLSQIANGQPITVVGDGSQKRDFTFVTDVCWAMIAASKNRFCGVLNVGSGGTYEINYLADLLGAKDRVYLPKRPGEPEITFADIKKTKFNLYWKPEVSFENGVAIMKDMIPKYKDAPLWTKDKIEVATKKWFEAFA